MRLSAANALRTRQESRRLGSFSKQWQSGQTLSVFVPIYWEDGKPEILAASVWGHSISPQELSLKRIFIPTNAVMVDNEPVTSDALMQFSRIAPLFVKGAYEQEKTKIDDKRAKGHLTEPNYRAALNKLDKDYDVEDGRIRKSAVVGPLRLVISTEVVTVLMDDQGKPKADTARLVVRDLSDTQIQKIYQIMANPDVGLEEGDKYVEIKYTFGTAGDRKLDAKVDPQPVMKDYRISARFPVEWETINRTVEMLPEETSTILKRNGSYKPVAEREIIRAISTYSVMQSELLDELNDEDDIDRLKRNAQVLRDLSIPVTNEEILAHIAEIEQEEANVQAKIASIEKAEDEAPAAPTIEDLELKKDIAEAKLVESLDDQEEIGSGSDSMNDLI